MKIIGIIILCLISLLSFYYGGSIMVLNTGSSFYFIWYLIGLFLLIIAFLWYKNLFKKIPKIIKVLFSICFTVGLIILIYTQVLVLSGFNYKSQDNLDYIIVLGAQIKDEGPSVVLKYRLDTAIDYLNNNPNTFVIVSGGKGVNEKISEAEGMKDYLIKKGIYEDRIIMEDKSTNTISNIINSMKLIDADNDKIGIVTNNFHLYRALQIAKKQGIKNVYGIKAYSTPYYLPNNCLRETVGILKDTIFGNM